MPTISCRVNDCTYVGLMRRVMCKKHYTRMMKHGSPHIVNETNPMERFMNFVKPVGECWEWQGHVSKLGYGQFSLRGEPMLAHRFAHLVFNGDTSLVIDHLCRNRKCVNPDHLEAVTL